MVAYKQHIVKYEDSGGTALVDLVVPPMGTGFLVQAMRLNYRIATNPIGVDFREFFAIVQDGLGESATIARIPMPASDNFVTIDIMPYYSNLAAYGLSNPAKWRMNLSHDIEMGDLVNVWGFSVTGAEA